MTQTRRIDNSMNYGYRPAGGYDRGDRPSYRGGDTYNNGGYHGKKSFWARILRKNRAFLLWFPAMLLYEELVFHISVGDVTLAGIFCTVMFSLSVGCLFTLISTVFINRINFYIVVAVEAVVTFIFCSQLVHISQSGAYFSFAETEQEAGTAAGFAGVLGVIVPILFLLVPLVFYCVWGKEYAPALGTPIRVKGMLLVLCIMFHLTALAGIVTSPEMKDVYGDRFAPEEVSGYFGLITETRLDIMHAISGENESDQ